MGRGDLESREDDISLSAGGSGLRGRYQGGKHFLFYHVSFCVTSSQTRTLFHELINAFLFSDVWKSHSSDSMLHTIDLLQIAYVKFYEWQLANCTNLIYTPFIVVFWFICSHMGDQTARKKRKHYVNWYSFIKISKVSCFCGLLNISEFWTVVRLNKTFIIEKAIIYISILALPWVT